MTNAFEETIGGFGASGPADTTPHAPSMTKKRPVAWLILFGLIAPINLLMSLDRQAITLSAPRIQHQFGFSLVEISTIVSCVLWTYAALQIPAGILLNRLGPRICLFFGCLIWSLATIITPLGSSFVGFLLIRLLMGAGQSPDWSSSVVTIDNWFPPGRKARANSILLAFLYLGSVIGGPLTTHIAVLWSWKVSFFVYGSIGVVWSFLWLFLVRDYPGAEKREKARTNPADRSAGLKQMRRLLGVRQFWSIGLHYMCLLTIQSFFLVMMPFYLTDHRHLSYLSMGWLYSMPWLFLYVSVFVSGATADFIQRRTGSVWMSRTPMGIIGTLLCGVLVAIGNQIESVPWMILTFSVALGLSGFSQISIWTSVQDLTKAHTGLVAGWTTFWGNAASGVAPIFMILLVKWTGSWSIALSVPLIAGMIGAICCAGTHPERPINME